MENMEIKDFIEKFSEQFEDTETTVFTPELEYKELDEWDSMMALTIISMIADEYNVPINGFDLKSSNTIQQLFETIKNKK